MNRLTHNSKNFMHRDKFFFASPSIFPKWPYKSRLAIGVRLADFRARNKKTFRFLIKGAMYEIDRTNAFRYGLKYMMPTGKLPNIIPLEEFTKTSEPTVEKANTLKNSQLAFL